MEQHLEGLSWTVERRASRLSVDPDHQVLLLEYGGGETNPMLQGNLSGPG